jgi:hypothetical protein
MDNGAAMNFEEGHRLIFSEGEGTPLVDISIIDDDAAADRVDALVDSFAGLYVGVNIGTNLPQRMRALYSSGSRVGYACPQADLRPMVDLINMAIEGSPYADSVKGFVLSNIVPPLFRFDDPSVASGNLVSYGCSCPECDEALGMSDLGDRLARMELRPIERNDGEEMAFAREVWVWATANSVLDDYSDLLNDRIRAYAPIMSQLAGLKGERYLMFSETDYPDSEFQVNGYNDSSRLAFGMGDDLLENLTGMIISPSFGTIADTQHIPIFEVDEIKAFIKMKYLEPKSKFMIDSILPPEVIKHVLQG